MRAKDKNFWPILRHKSLRSAFVLAAAACVFGAGVLWEDAHRQDTPAEFNSKVEQEISNRAQMNAIFLHASKNHSNIEKNLNRLQAARKKGDTEVVFDLGKNTINIKALEAVSKESVLSSRDLEQKTLTFFSIVALLCAAVPACAAAVQHDKVKSLQEGDTKKQQSLLKHRRERQP